MPTYTIEDAPAQPKYTVEDAPSAPPPGIHPEARTLGNYLKEGVYGVGRGLKNDVLGTMKAIADPTQAVTDLARQTYDAGSAAATEFRDTKGAPTGQRIGATTLTALENAPVIGGMVQKAEEGGERMGSPEAVGAAAEGIISFEAPGLVGKGVAKILPKAVEAGKSAVRSAAGTGPKVTAKLVEDAKAENAASAAKATEAKAVEAKRGSLQKDIHEKSRETQARIETARENALKEGNQKYSAVNEALNEFPADMDKLQGAYADAAQSFGDAAAIPPIIKRLEKSMNEPLTYADEQKVYSELGRELSKGTLPGTTYHAYDTLHEAVGNDMQRIADSQGMGQQLTDARNYWRRMKQTFGKPYVARDAASKTLRTLSPEFSKEEATGNATRMLGHYDPEIPRVAGDVTEARRGLKSLPKAKPTEPVVRKIGADDIRGAKTESIAKKANKIETSGNGLANTFAFLGAIRSALHGDIGGVGMDIAARGAYGVGKSGVAKLLRSKPFVEWATKATPADVAQIPPEMRGDLGSIIQAAKAQGINVSPALTAAAMAGQSRKGVGAALGATP